MNIKPRPLLIAAGSGLAIQIIITLITLGLAFFMGSGDLTTVGESTMLGAVAVIGLLACLCPLVIDIGVGGLYSFLHARLDRVKVEDGVFGGAAASALARLVTGFFSICANLVITPLMQQQQMGNDISPEMLGITLGSSLIGGIVGLIIALVVGCVLGAVGGGIGAAIFTEKSDYSAITPNEP